MNSDSITKLGNRNNGQLKTLTNTHLNKAIYGGRVQPNHVNTNKHPPPLDHGNVQNHDGVNCATLVNKDNQHNSFNMIRSKDLHSHNNSVTETKPNKRLSSTLSNSQSSPKVLSTSQSLPDVAIQQKPLQKKAKPFVKKTCGDSEMSSTTSVPDAIEITKEDTGIDVPMDGNSKKRKEMDTQIKELNTFAVYNPGITFLKKNKKTDEHDLENEISVHLPLAGPFVFGFLSDRKAVFEVFEGDQDSVIHDTTSKILFAISRHGGTIESLSDQVTFPLSEAEAVATDFIRDRRVTLKDAIKIAFIETKNNHDAILNETRSKFISFHNRKIEGKNRIIIGMKDVMEGMTKRHLDDLDRVNKNYAKKLEDTLAIHKKEVAALEHRLKEEKKAHKRGLTACLNASQMTFQRLKEETGFSGSET